MSLDTLQQGQKVTLARTMAQQLGCPCTPADLQFVDTFLHQLHGIERANVLAQQMGVDNLDFAVETQTTRQYLKAENYLEMLAKMDRKYMKSTATQTPAGAGKLR